MEVNIYTHPEFERQFKRFNKKYHSLKDDFSALIKSLKEKPYQGTNLGNGIRKVRLGVSNKGGGKRGGMRVITYSVNKVKDETIDITLLYIYDKSEIGNVSDKFISYLLSR